MLYYVLISVVIFAEFIIAAEIMGQLFKWNKIFKETNLFLDEAKPKIKDISRISLKISEQLKELAPYWITIVRKFFINILTNNIKNALLGLFIWSVRKKLKKN